MSKKLPKSINLLEPVNRPDDVWDHTYEWLFNVGKYILVAVEIVVLAVFLSRFYIDNKNNKLTEEINANIDILSDPFFKQGEIKYNNLHSLLADIRFLSEQQPINSKLLAAAKDSVPSNIYLERISFSRDVVSMSFMAQEFSYIQKYESDLRSNNSFEDVRVSLSKSGEGEGIEFLVTYKIKPEEAPVNSQVQNNSIETE